LSVASVGGGSCAAAEASAPKLARRPDIGWETTPRSTVSSAAALLAGVRCYGSERFMGLFDLEPLFIRPSGPFCWPPPT
jgi:hypothetical protein